MNDFFAKGEWWIPEHPGNKVSGDLRFSQESGGILELRGMFTSIDEFGIPVSLIVGRSTDGKEYTLRSNMMIGATHSFLPTVKFRSQQIFEGLIAGKDSDLSFDTASIGLTYLYDWAGRRGTVFNTPNRETSLLTYVMPADVDVLLGSTQLSVSFGSNVTARWQESRISETVSFYLKPDKRISVDMFLSDYCFPLLNFLNFATGQQNVFESIRFVVNGDRPLDAKCFYQQIGLRREKKDLAGPSMLLNLDKIDDQFSTFINNWFLLTKSLSPVVNLFWRDRGHNCTTLEVRLLTLTHALEAYHREKFGGQLIAPDKFRTVRDEMLTLCPEELKGIFADALNWVPAMSLCDRLNALVSGREEILIPLVGNPEYFTKSAKDHRNYYTHYGSDLKRRIFEPHALIALCDALSVLLESCLLSEVGVPEDKHLYYFQSYSGYQRALHGSETLKSALNGVYNKR